MKRKNKPDKKKRFQVPIAARDLSLASGELPVRLGMANPFLEKESSPNQSQDHAQIQNADDFYRQGELFRQAGQFEEASHAYLQAVNLNPSHHQTLGALGKVLSQLCRYAEAMEFFSLALKAAPTPWDNLDHLFHLGQLYKKVRHFELAVECYQAVLKMNPGHRDALIALCQVFRQLCQTGKAIEIYDRLLALKPDDPSLLLSKALSLPLLYTSQAEILKWRQTVDQQFDILATKNFKEDRSLALHGSSFYLAYQGLNDRDLMLKIGTVFQKLLPPAPNRVKHVHNDQPKIGIVSRFLAPSHTIGRLMQGIIQHLSRDKFQVVTFSVGRDTAYVPQGDEHPQDVFVVLPENNIEQAAREIMNHQPDILLYADLGMNVTTYCLAGMRLAPVQCVTWGHPVTSGLSTIDYFISSKWIEPENAQAHYCETLVRLDGLPTYYYPPQVSEPVGNRQQFGLSETANLYLCPQSLFKFHPDFDPILAAILKQDPKGELVLVSHYTEAVNQQLMARFKAHMPDVVERIHILPRLDRERFLQLLTCGDVMLDPMHFGGGNTTYEALGLGVPIVTWPSEYMRGRVTAGCYRQMGLNDLVADSAEAYVQLAVKLGTDAEYKMQTQERILAQNHRLFEDHRVIEELEAFFLKALDETGVPAHD